MRTILLTKGQVALVDDEDYEWLSQWKWTAKHTDGRWYAVRAISRPGKCALHIYMHREVNKTPPGQPTDHIDGDGLNNRRGNLRTVTARQNAQNASAHRDAASRFKGVSRNAKLGKPWVAMICVDGKQTSLGVFDTELEAARAYEAAAEKHFGQFRRKQVLA